MENNSNEFTLPPAPRGLCFDRNDFVKTNFSVDNFLADHQNVVTLETMRDDLGAYLKILRLAMIELINKDYANFVNLSATLIGFDKAIEKLQVPLGQLNDDVLSVRHSLEDAMKELSMWLNQRHALQKKKLLLKYYGQTVNCLSTLEKILTSISEKKHSEQIALADRAAMQYNQLKYSIKKCDNIINPGQNAQFNNLSSQLIHTLNNLVFQFWNDSDEENLLKTLITLNSLDRVAETEMLLRKQAVAPLLQDIINEPSLQRSRDGLLGIYTRILSLLDSKLKLLMMVMQHSKLAFFVKKYNFLVNCFWCEVESRLEVNLASIFAPGNPKIFYTRYNESMDFIKQIESYCSDKETIQLLHNTAEYRSFQKRWNLPVYFQIRFQEIAGSYESMLLKTPTIQNNNGFLLKETAACWMAIQQCWSDGIYIQALAHKFWKLSLQMLSRYATWASTYCIQASNSLKSDTSTINKSLINSSISIYIDSRTLIERLPNFLHMVEGRINISNKELLSRSLQCSEQNLSNLKEKIKECIVKELFNNFNVQLKQVNEIPRLYRKTNRSVPTKPCSYLEMVSNAMIEFNKDASKRLDHEFLVDFFTALFNVLTVSYYKYVKDVLTSVQKTEESLRRLKRIREMSSPQSNESSGVTDDDKIRLQLNVDVISYRKLVESVNVDVKRVEKYNELYSMVTDAVKNINNK